MNATLRFLMGAFLLAAALQSVEPASVYGSGGTSVDSKPVVGGVLTAVGTVGVPFSYQIIATNGPTTFTASGLPPGLSVNSSSGLISGTPSAAGQSVVALGAANAAGAASANLILNVQASGLPSITTHPQPRGEFAGGTVSFSVAASGTGLIYQWRRNGSAIAGGTLATHTIMGVQSVHAGNYDVVVSNGAGGVTSGFAALTVNNPPAIRTQPVSVAAKTGGLVSFSVSATGTALAYQWFKNGVAISGATASAYSIPAAALSDAGVYKAVVSSVVVDGATVKTKSVDSSGATLSVVQVPQISVHPQSQAVVVGANVTLSVTATGATALKYQWRKWGVNIDGAVGPTYTLNAVQEDQAGSYDVEVSDSNNVKVTSQTASLSVRSVPKILLQPIEVKVAEGSPAVFSVVATGGGTLGFQWRKNGVAIPGATASVYKIDAVQKGDEAAGSSAAGYDVVVAGGVGGVVSSRVGLTVVEGGALLSENPLGSSVKPGASYTLRVTAVESEVTYQWRKNGVPITGATASSYSLSVGTADAGRYDVLVRNAFGEVISSPAYIGIASNFVANLQKAAYQWAALAGNGLPGAANGTGAAAQFNTPSSIALHAGTLYVSDSENHAIRRVTLSGSVTTVGGSLTFSGTANGAALSTARFELPQGIAVDKSGTLYIAEPSSNTVRRLTNPGGTNAAVSTVAGVSGQFGVPGGLINPREVALDSGGALYVMDDLTIRRVDTATQFTRLFGEEAYTGTQPVPVAMVADSSGRIFAAANDGGEFRIFSRVAGGTFAVTGYGPYPYHITDLAVGPGSNLYAANQDAALILGDTSQSVPAAGLPVNLTGAAEIDWAPGALAVDTDGTVYAVDPYSHTVLKGVPSGLPVFLQQPVGVKGMEGVPLNLSAVAVGPGTISYQWYRDGVPIPGATASSYSLDSGGAAGGVYAVEARNLSGSVISATAIVEGSSSSVLGILKQPQSAVVVSGGTHAMEVLYRGPTATTFQWYRNGVALTGATSSSISFPAVRGSDGGDYSVVLSSGTTKLTSEVAKLIVNVPVSIFAQPEDVAVAAGGQVSLKVSATGTQPLTYQWRKNGQNIPGATQAVYEFAADSAASYDVQVNNVVGLIETSGVAKVLILVPPVLTVQPQETLVVNQNSTAVLSVTASGSQPLVYQWRKDGVPIAGGTAATLTVQNVQGVHAGVYDVSVSNALGSAASRPLKLSVNFPASILSQPPSTISAAIGTPVSLRVTAGGTGPFEYQWFRSNSSSPNSGTLISGADQPVYAVPTSAAGSTLYRVRVKSRVLGDWVESAGTTVTVSTARGISILQTPPQQTGVIRGTAAVLRVTLDANPATALSTTYRLLLKTGATLTDTGISGLVPASGDLEVPLRGLTVSGTYVLALSREYADGQVVDGVKTAEFSLQLKTLEDAAGIYELLLTDSNGLVGDGATYRGVLLVTVTRTGAVSGRVLYNEAPPLDGASGGERTYTAVSRSFSSTFAPSPTDPAKLVCAPRLGLGTQADRQRLDLELDFSSGAVVLNATMLDRISVPPAIDAEGCVSRGVGAVRGATKLDGVLVGATSVDFSSLVGRYVLGSDFALMQGGGPGEDNNATILAQVLATGKVLWASRLSGFTGSGSATLSMPDRESATAQLYEGRTLSSITVHSTNSLLGQMRFRRLTGGTVWESSVGTAAGDDKLERQSCYITKANKLPVYEGVRFDLSSAGFSSFNWSGVRSLDFQYGTTCRWTGSTAAGLSAFLNPDGTGTTAGISPLYLVAEDPAGEGTYAWTVSVSSTGVVKASNYSATDVQPALTLRLDRTRGEWVGSYLSPVTRQRRAISGVVARPGGGDPLRGAGWVETGATPATQTAGWRLELTPP